MEKVPRFIAPMTFGESFAALTGFAKSDNDFPKAFADFIGTKYAILAPSGRFAAAAILKALALPKGGEVILPALTFHSIPQMIREAGLSPVFVDIASGIYCIDPDKIEAAITDKTVAMLPTHLYGRACDMEKIGRIAKDRNLRVVEDCAQAAGGFWGQKRLGSLGDAGFFSFGPTKNLAALWAGMVTTDSEEIARESAKLLGGMPAIGFLELTRRLLFALAMRFVTRPVLWRLFMAPLLSLFSARGTDPIEKLTSESPGKGNPADQKARQMPHNFQNRIALSQLGKLDRSNRMRERNGTLLIEKLSKAELVGVPDLARSGENIFMSFPVTVDNRDRFRKRMLAKDVDTATGYMSVCPGMEDRQEARIIAPVAFEIVDRMVHIPVYPELDPGDIDRIATAIILSCKE